MIILRHVLRTSSIEAQRRFDQPIIHSHPVRVAAEHDCVEQHRQVVPPLGLARAARRTEIRRKVFDQ